MANPDMAKSSPAKTKPVSSPDKSQLEQKSKKRKQRSPSSSSGPTRKKKPSTATASSSKTSEPPHRPTLLPPAHILIIDNGGDTIKYGWASPTTGSSTGDENDAPSMEATATATATPSPPFPHIMPNLTARLQHQWTILVGDEIERVQNQNSLYGITRSTERGIITNLGNQTQVWKRVLDQVGVLVSPSNEAAAALGWGKVGGRATAANSNNNNKASSSTLAAASSKTATTTTIIPAQLVAVLILLPPHCPRVVLDQIVGVWLDDLGVGHIGFGNSATCAAQEHATWKTSCVVDLGWSATTIVPTFQKKPIDPSKAIRRIPIGGRHMVNMLKYYMSYRQYNLMDQEKILRNVFEDLAYLSTDFGTELALARHIPSGRRPFDRDYILPDYQTTDQGRIRLPLAMQRQMELEEKRQKEGVTGEENDKGEESSDEDFNEADDLESKDDDKDDDGNGEDDEDDENGNDVKEDERSNIGDDDDEEEAGSEEEDQETPEERRERVLKQRDEERRRKLDTEDDEQILRVSVERFTVPEVLFRPMDAGLLPQVMGISRAIHESIQATPKPYRPALYQSIFVTGGVSKLKNFRTRLHDELRTLIPTDYPLDIQMSESPISHAWLGAHEWVRQTPYTEWSISRKEWEAASRRDAYSKLLVSNGGRFV
jgi:actin-related protein